MAYIQAEKVSYRYTGNIDYTLKNISFRLDSNSRIGLIGDNGTGKTTLLKLLSRELAPEGVIDFRLEPGVLSQEISDLEMSVIEQIYNQHPQLLALKNQIENFTGEDLDVFSEYEELGGWDFETELEIWLSKFKLSEMFLRRSLKTLSGGEKTKVGIISLVMRSPDVLLLDEPTNHLDLESILWLEEYLKNQKKPYLVISHDRTFLDNTTTTTWEIDDGMLVHFSGNYSFYKQKKQEEHDLQKKLYEQQTKKIKQLTKDAQQKKKWALGFQGETGTNGYSPVYEDLQNLSKKSMRHAKVAQKRVERILEKEKQNRPEYKEPARIEFRQKKEKSGKNCLTIRNLSKSFSKNLFDDLNLIVSHGERVSITGVNGSGKTTLLKMIIGQETIDKGDIFTPENLAISYYSQEYENLDYSQTILDELTGGNYVDQANVRKSLGSIGFQGDDVFNKISDLSPGERSKVAIVKVMLSDSSLLLLDEPTNHLEIRTREVVEEALLRYKGTIIFVSHDRKFQEKIATRTFSLDRI